jgi:hypothetical protein
MYGLVLLSTSVSTADLVTLKIKALHHTQLLLYCTVKYGTENYLNVGRNMLPYTLKICRRQVHTNL